MPNLIHPNRLVYELLNSYAPGKMASIPPLGQVGVFWMLLLLKSHNNINAQRDYDI